jgi:hypothetical protein
LASRLRPTADRAELCGTTLPTTPFYGESTLDLGGGAGTYHVFGKSVAEDVKVRFYVCVETNDNVPIGTCSADVSATA